MATPRPKFKFKVTLTFSFAGESAAQLFYHLPDGLDGFTLWSALVEQYGQVFPTTEPDKEAKR